MSDLVDKLRKGCVWHRNIILLCDDIVEHIVEVDARTTNVLMSDAADEIERLTAELAEAKLRLAGCQCEQPLIGDRDGVPRCRLCNVEVSHATN